LQIEKINNDESYDKNSSKTEQIRLNENKQQCMSGLSRQSSLQRESTTIPTSASVDADTINHNIMHDNDEQQPSKPQEHHSSKRSLHSNKMQLNVMGKIKDRQGVPV
jgi:hypothetical protein